LKKLILILLTGIYALAVFGTATSTFYCCEKAASVNNITDCCNNDYQRAEFKTLHVAASFHSPARSLQNIYTNISAFAVAKVFQQLSFTNNNTAIPGLHQSVPVYILHCVYRL